MQGSQKIGQIKSSTLVYYCNMAYPWQANHINILNYDLKAYGNYS